MRDLLESGGPNADTVAFHRRWQLPVRLALMGMDKENGTLVHTMGPGGMLEQGYLTTLFVELVQGEFVRHANKMAEEARSRMAVRNGRR